LFVAAIRRTSGMQGLRAADPLESAIFAHHAQEFDFASSHRSRRSRRGKWWPAIRLFRKRPDPPFMSTCERPAFVPEKLTFEQLRPRAPRNGL